MYVSHVGFTIRQGARGLGCGGLGCRGRGLGCVREKRSPRVCAVEVGDGSAAISRPVLCASQVLHVFVLFYNKFSSQV